MSARIRPRRVGDLLRRELSDVFQRDIRDPRVSLVSITAVDVSNDLQHARVYLSSVDPQADVAEIVQVLDRAKGFIRVQLGKRKLGLRHMPELRFVHDESVELGGRIDELLRGTPQDEEDEE